MIRPHRLGRGRHASRRTVPPPTADEIGGVLWVLNAPALVGLWWVSAHRSRDAAEHRPQVAANSKHDAAPEDDAA